MKAESLREKWIYCVNGCLVGHKVALSPPHRLPFLTLSLSRSPLVQPSRSWRTGWRQRPGRSWRRRPRSPRRSSCRQRGRGRRRSSCRGSAPWGRPRLTPSWRSVGGSGRPHQRSKINGRRACLTVKGIDQAEVGGVIIPRLTDGMIRQRGSASSPSLASLSRCHHRLPVCLIYGGTKASTSR